MAYLVSLEMMARPDDLENLDRLVYLDGMVVMERMVCPVSLVCLDRPVCPVSLVNLVYPEERESRLLVMREHLEKRYEIFEKN